MRQFDESRLAVFHPRARETIRGFPRTAKQSLGEAIWDLQCGVKLRMPQSRPMVVVAPGVEELRIKDASGAFRVFYYLRDARGILVFHAFVKKSQKTAQDEIDTGRRRLREMMNEAQ
jgi:phage-related protein